MTTSIQRLDVDRGADGSIIFDPNSMTADVPYRFSFLGQDVVAVKSQEGAMDFFHFPDDTDEAPSANAAV